MAKKAEVKESLVQFKDADGVVQYKNTLNGLKAKPDVFVKPTIDLETYASDLTDFEEKLAYEPKTPEKTSIKNNARKTINSNYKKQAKYVNALADGDETILDASNFIKKSQNVKPEKDGFRVENGEKPGTFDFIIKKIKKAKSYQLDVRTINADGESVWTFCKVMGSTDMTFDGFVSGQLYEFRVKAIFAKTEGAYLSPYQIRAL